MEPLATKTEEGGSSTDDRLREDEHTPTGLLRNTEMSLLPFPHFLQKLINGVPFPDTFALARAMPQPECTLISTFWRF